MIKKLFQGHTTKKVNMNDIVSPTPSRNAVKAVKTALENSYTEQQIVRKKASMLRSN